MKKIILVLLISTLNLCAFSQDNSEVQNKDCSRPRDNFYDRYLHTEKKPLAYDYVHEKDVFWEKRIWRLIDTREKMNHSFTNAKNPLIKIIMEGALNEKINLYSSIDDEFSSMLSLEEINEIMYQTDSTVIIDPETYLESVVVIKNDLNFEDIKKFRIKEVWFFDEETSTMNVRILGIAPIITRYQQNGFVLNEGPMFWAYYPQCRELFAQSEVFNPHNDAIRMTWDDLFESRFFSSYIIKESNNYDRRLKDYVSNGIDILLESDKIKESIFNFEHDLWSY